MRRLIFGLLAGVAVLMSSCLDDDDDYSLGKFWVQLGIIDKQGPESFTVTLDDGSVIFPVAGNYYGNPLNDAERVIVNYSIINNKLVNDSVKEYYVQINSMKKILKKGILDITEANEDSIGNDPIIITDAWVSENQLLNFQIRYYGNYQVHYINLVKQPGELNAGMQPIELEFRHNENDDPRNYSMTGIVSFDMSAIQIAGIDSVRFKVQSKDYDGKVNSFEGVYHY